MDLSKVFNSINLNLLVTKAEAYGFTGISLQVMRSRLKNSKQRS